MTNYHIDLENIDLENPSVGIMQKVCIRGKKRLRLLRFLDNFVENEWCTNAHIGYVLSGTMKIDYNGSTVEYKQGDGLWILEGEASKHKVKMEKGKQVDLILFESTN